MGEPGKKQVPLRLSVKLYEELAAWAEEDFRSVNGQIEYLLTACVRQHKKNGGVVPAEISKPEEQFAASTVILSEGSESKDL